jgi:hypothetical protein
MKRLLVLAILCTATVASAQTASLPDGSTLNFIRIYLHENNSATLVQPAQLPNSLWHYFNFAHCVCSEPNAAMDPNFKETTFAYLLQLQGVTNGSELQPLVGQVWVGTMCNSDALTRSTYCHHVSSADIPSIGGIQTTNGITPEIPIVDMMEPESNPISGCGTTQFCLKPCEQRVLMANEWVGVDTMMSGTPDYWVNQEVDTDSQPPPTPTNFTAVGSEGGVLLSWTAPAGNVSDIAYYQALCTTDLGDPALSSPPAPRYITPRSLCGAAQDALLVPCNFSDPDNPNTCTAMPTSTTTTDAGIDAPDASDFARTPPLPPIDAQVDAGIDAGIDADTSDIDASGGPTDAAVKINLESIAQLPAAYICGESDDATSTSLQISGLQNNVNYTVALLAIDKFGNAAGVYFNQPLTPKPVTDFWEDLHNKGSRVEGGFCLIAETYGDDNPLTNALRRFRDHTLADTAFGRWLTDVYYATLGKAGAVVHAHWTLRILSGILLLPLVVLALLWHYLTLPGLLAISIILTLRRRVMRSRLAARVVTAGTLGLVLLAAPSRAHAQAPYWENQATGSDDEATGFADTVPVVKWHVAVGIGPYTPDIDAQSTMRNSAGQGPYQAMFGGYTIMPKLDVDRFLWTGFGQLGVGISVGYMGKSANAYVIPSDPNDPNRPRSPGDTTAFRMIPIQLTAIYRMSVLDDDYGIPIVPYVRGGVGYYVWWSTVDGHLSQDPMDPSNQSDGASAGLVGTVGLSFRAERIDAQAARAMREGGIEHAGFFAEINAGWIDGFGKATKLDVGDTTWFAGAEFEF